MEGEEGTIEAKGEVVLLSVDELVAFRTKKKSITCLHYHAHVSVCLYNWNLNLTCDIGQQDGEKDHSRKQGGHHDVQDIPAARGHLEEEEDVRKGGPASRGSG